MVRRSVAAGCVAIAVAAWAPAAAIDDAAIRAARYLVAQQKPSGAFFSADQPADGVAEVVVSLAASGVAGAPIDRALAYVRANGPSVASEPAYAGRIVLGIVASGGNPRSFGGVDYVARITPDSKGAYYSTLYGHSLAVLGLLAARAPVPPRAMQHIRDHQCPDGGFAYDPNCTSADVKHALKGHVDTTSLVLCILVASRVSPTDEARSRARSFLASAMNSERGFGEYPGASEATNANSTGLALSAIAAIGESPSSAPWRSGARDPAQALRALQTPSGGFRLRADQAKVNDYATVQAVPGLVGVAYPVRPRSRVASANPTTAATSVPRVPSAAMSPTASTVAENVVASPTTGGVSVQAATGETSDSRSGEAPGGRGLVTALAVAGCAGAAEALRRRTRRWTGSRAR